MPNIRSLIASGKSSSAGKEPTNDLADRESAPVFLAVNVVEAACQFAGQLISEDLRLCVSTPSNTGLVLRSHNRPCRETLLSGRRGRLTLLPKRIE